MVKIDLFYYVKMNFFTVNLNFVSLILMNYLINNRIKSNLKEV